MGMSIRTNVSALDAQKNLMGTENDLNSSLAEAVLRLSHHESVRRRSGPRISVNLGAQIKSYNQAVRNAQRRHIVVQTADGSLNETRTS